MRELKEIPEAVKKWAFCEMPGVKSFLIYKKRGRNVEAFCTTCGRYMEGISEAETLEDEARSLLRPAHNAESRCPKCGVIGQWKSRGLCRGVYGRDFNYIFGQKIGEDFVFRACACQLTIFKDTVCQIEDIEYARVYLSKGKKPDKWWYVTRYGVSEWVNYYPGYYGSAGIDRSHYYPGTIKSIRQTPMLKYGLNTRHWDTLTYYEALSRYPDLEIVEKLGMTELAYALVYQRGANVNPRGKTIWDRLRINKDRLADLKANKGNLHYLHIYQAERKAGHRLNNEEIAKEIYIRNMWSTDEKRIMRCVFDHCTVERFKKYIDKQEEKRKRNTGDYWAVKQTYIDYIRMRIDRGYDLADDAILFPKDLKRRHDEMVEEALAKKAAEKRKSVNEKWPQISKKFDKLNRKFNYSKDGFLIRPAMEAAEIADEGRELHHCVGSGDTYYSKHSKGESFILFLRKMDEPDKPFATIEISGSRILQWYEAYDKKPDAKILQPWLDDYTKYLADKNKRKKAAAG